MKMFTMNNLGIGVDVESVNRFENFKIEKDMKLLEKIFSKKEIDYCFSKKNPAPHLAARYACKEAVFKAVNSIFDYSLSYKEITRDNANHGMPFIVIDKEGFPDVTIKLSLSHNKDVAIAFVVLVQEKSQREIIIEKN